MPEPYRALREWLAETDAVTVPLATRTCPEGVAPPRPACLDANLLFLNGHRTGGSSMGGVARHIAARHGLACASCSRTASVAAAEPRVFADHHSGSGAEVAAMVRSSHKQVFTWGLVREPVARCLSAFYHPHVSRKGAPAEDDELEAYARDRCSDRLWHYYSRAGRVDFMGVTERFHESLVALAHLLALPLGDLLYVATKDSAGRGEAVLAAGAGQCLLRPLRPRLSLANHSARVRDWFRGPFLPLNAHDLRLFKHANRRLDALRAQVGAHAFEYHVLLLEFHLAQARRRCRTLLPGDWSRCYFRDHGCQFACLDAYALAHGLGRIALAAWPPPPKGAASPSMAQRRASSSAQAPSRPLHSIDKGA